jgi:hypothetical protein
MLLTSNNRSRTIINARSIPVDPIWRRWLELLMKSEAGGSLLVLHQPRLTIPLRGNTTDLLVRRSVLWASLPCPMIWTRCILVDSCLRSHLQACYSQEECLRTDMMDLRILSDDQAVLSARSNPKRNPQPVVHYLGSMLLLRNREAHDMPLLPKQVRSHRLQMLRPAPSQLPVSTCHRHNNLCSKCNSKGRHEDQHLAISTTIATDLFYEHLLQIHHLNQFHSPILPEPLHGHTWLHKKRKRKDSKPCVWRRSNANKPKTNTSE